MAATTITRATITDDDGSTTTGTVFNSAWVGTAIYDKVDALFAAASTIFEGSTNGERHLKLVNTSTGASAYAYVSAGNDAGTYGSYQTTMTAYGTNHGTLPDASEFAGVGAGGVYLTANNAAGAVRFRTGGTNTRGGVLAAGHLWLAELAANPGTGDLTADSAVAVYTKADKFVIAYNNGGTMTYITLDLDGSDTTWAHGTGAP